MNHDQQRKSKIGPKVTETYPINIMVVDYLLENRETNSIYYQNRKTKTLNWIKWIYIEIGHTTGPL